MPLTPRPVGFCRSKEGWGDINKCSRLSMKNKVTNINKMENQIKIAKSATSKVNKIPKSPIKFVQKLKK